jgi:hypothetical protein
MSHHSGYHQKPNRFPRNWPAFADRVCQTDGVGLPLPDPDVHAGRIEQLISDFVEPARADALEDLGQGRRAFGIAASFVRGKLAD